MSSLKRSPVPTCPQLSPGTGSALSSVPSGPRPGQAPRRPRLGRALTTSAQHSSWFIAVPGKPQELGGGGGGWASAPVRLRSPCTHHVIYSVRATGSIGLALIIHSLSGPNFAPFFFRNLGGSGQSSGVNAFRARAERTAGRGGGWGRGGDVWPSRRGGRGREATRLRNKEATVSARP